MLLLDRDAALGDLATALDSAERGAKLDVVSRQAAVTVARNQQLIA
jgi:hypothetical protein